MILRVKLAEAKPTASPLVVLDAFKDDFVAYSGIATFKLATSSAGKLQYFAISSIGKKKSGGFC